MPRRGFATLVATLIALLAVAAAGNAAPSPQPGIDPAKEPLVGAFSCYFDTASDQYAAPSFVLEILAGRQYRTPFGSGQFTIDPSQTLSISFTTGPLVNTIESAALFGDHGQRLSFVKPIGAADDAYCYQQGPREQLARLEFRAKDPQPGSYPCVAEDGSSAASLEILPGRAYSYGGAAGTYTVNILGRQTDKSSSVDFVGGPFDNRFAFYTAEIETGIRKMAVSLTTGPDLDCGLVFAPTPAPRYGTKAAARSGKVRGGFAGMYAAWQVDVLGVCSGLCWTFYTFTPNGDVYTRDPEFARNDAACGRTYPNGLPVCERYRVRGRTIQIGAEKAVAFARVRQGIRIGGRLFRPVRPLPANARLTGKYVTQNFFPNPVPGTGGVITQRTYVFSPAGRFERQGFAGATFSPPAGQPGVGVTVSSQNGSAGSYRIVGGNTLQLRFDNGAVRRLFAFIPDGRVPRPKLLHLADGDYLPKP